MKKLIVLLASLAILMESQAQFKQASLHYSFSDLEPYIDSTTMIIHYTQHHATYTKRLNETIEKNPELKNLTIIDLLKLADKLTQEVQLSVKNNGGGYFNHNFFWSILAPAGSTTISPAMSKMIENSFGSIENFKTEFEKAAMSRFGSGWVWLIKTKNGKLIVTSTANQDSPFTISKNKLGTPILNLDVWEHAYYLKYQSKRASYIKAFWNVVNWNEVEKLATE